MGMIAENIDIIVKKINTCRLECHRDDTVSLLCVSKTKPLEDIKAAYDAGQRHFGENYVQEAALKIEQFKQNYGLSDIKWHFIGPIQSNKSKTVANIFDMVESVDREKIARRLNEQRDENLPALDILVQVNISDEAQKSGCAIANVDSLVTYIKDNCPKLRLRGFMVIALDTQDIAEIKREFLKIRDIFNTYKEKYKHFDTLSMGMTSDMECAIECGSTQVRIGSAIFGSRNYTKE
ncbi:Predicted enzyme with a TIM-barrel fold [Anaerobiospirillum thomasii]|uniref:Pyridoxal phosphate homeostasis protein n=2 Tax=Anaerobiospirillum thomasii TaxID=179995 RepID=A0A2X0WG12_9GAMM|nr:YggS family pyridoxal phosphate-dependent enzyme [Anaerobiospirillum thomasii]SPT69317.1 Predicted enzyme with a TIM-barrel fold [Anaerobiospirillum thomasii]SPT72118.1 Predicted enzyme with a TIM-barrel fold [Anaerobiospirillum thomasii]